MILKLPQHICSNFIEGLRDDNSTVLSLYCKAPPTPAMDCITPGSTPQYGIQLRLQKPLKHPDMSGHFPKTCG